MIIVIGAGILGASTAYHLAKKGEKVLLVDRFDKGQATDAAAGIICPWLSQRRNKAWYALAKGGAKYYPELIQMLEDDGEIVTGYKRVGTLKLEKEAKLNKLYDIVMKRKEEAPEIGDVQILSLEETQKHFPLLSTEYGSIFVSGGARVDGRLIRDALINGAKRNGAIVEKGSASLIYENNKVIGIQIDGKRTIEGNLVVDCTGAWSKQLLEPLNLSFDVTHQRAQIIHLELPDVDTSDWPVVMPPGQTYLLTFPEGRIVIGATRTDEAQFEHRVTVDFLADTFNQVLPIAPELRESSLLEVRVGFKPYTPGFLPMFGKLPNIEGIVVGNGLGATGLTSGPYVGHLLSQLITGEKLDVSIAPYQVSDHLE